MVRVATIKHSENDVLTVSWDSIRRTCINDLYAAAFAEGMNAWNAAIDSLLSQYMRTVNNCWLPPMNETFTASYISSEYHYTLYYYDQAGNLVQTVSPEGVRPLTIANGVWDGVSEPQHGLLVTYQFNTLGQTIRQTSPDGGTTVFYHDDLKRLRLSQNAEQAGNGEYAFVKYDYLSRPVESGKLSGYSTSPTNSLFATDINTPSFPTTGISESTRTFYTTAFAPYNQENLIGRVSRVSNDNISTYYSYDEIGNVKRLWHDIAGMGATVNIAYQYDLVSGKVNQVDYQKGYQDQFSHRYNYDADNRLRSVETSADGYIWNREAKYQYYVHGQLARVELGDKVAGNDHYYNMQGWILGVNAMGEGEYHLGKDGQTANGTLNRWIARDAYSYQLAYYYKSYSPIGNYADYNISNDLISQLGTVPAGHTGQPGLYNGNISGMITQLADGMLNGKVFAETFTYDQLHRIIGGVAGISTVSTDMGGFESSLDLHISNDFGTNYKYDANGNIKNLGRSHLGRPIDELSYTYNQLPSGMLEHNRLQVIDDAVGSAGVGDLGSTAGGYTYDAIGRLVEDPSEYIRRITWNMQDKVTRVQFTNGNPDVEYAYDVQGNRLMKNNGNTLSFYVRDAQGNVLAIYEKTPDGMIQKEVHLYGSSRLGSWHTNRTMDAQTARKFNYTRGHRTYEQSNHLGNVLTTITDLAHGVDDNADKIAEYYAASVQYASLYYPFGWEIPALTYSATHGGNRYGFNGKENDQEWKIQDYGFRLYNQRIARFFSVDPLAPKFPELTPYQFASNTPIQAIDMDGLEAWVAYKNIIDNNAPVISYYFDPDLLPMGGIYEVTRHYETSHELFSSSYVLTSVRWGVSSYSEHSEKFPNNGKYARSDKKGPITIDVESGITYGHIAAKIGGIGFNFQSGGYLLGVSSNSESGFVTPDPKNITLSGEIELPFIGSYGASTTADFTQGDITSPVNYSRGMAGFSMSTDAGFADEPTLSIGYEVAFAMGLGIKEKKTINYNIQPRLTKEEKIENEGLKGRMFPQIKAVFGVKDKPDLDINAPEVPMFDRFKQLSTTQSPAKED